MTQSEERLAPLFLKAGIPEDEHAEALEIIEESTLFLVVLLKANEDVAPNYLTMGMVADETRYELTIRLVAGLTPAEKISELEAERDQLRATLEALPHNTEPGVADAGISAMGQISKLRAEVKQFKKDDKQLRKMLFLRHGCGFVSLYGDDGEMQCSECILDFKRMSIEDIQKRWEAIGRKKLETP